MIIQLNDILFDGADYTLKTPIDGIYKPDVRTTQGNFSGRDGGWLSGQFYSGREIVLNGFVYGDPGDNETKLSNLAKKLPIRTALPFYLTDKRGNSYFTEVYFIAMNVSMEIQKKYEFQITLFAPDNNFYIADPSDPNAGWTEKTVAKPIGGGYSTPYVLPVTWATGTGPTIVTNPTDQIILPQLVLNGTYTNPKITNTTTGLFIQINTTTTNGDEMVVDMKNRTVTLNGGSILPAKSGSWWGMVKGDNYIELATDSGADDNMGVVRYRVGYNSVFEVA